jgi:hypothetical protein
VAFVELYGNVMYVSKLGLGTNIEMPLYIENNKLYLQSEMNGNMVEVKWLEEGKSVEPITV